MVSTITLASASAAVLSILCYYNLATVLSIAGGRVTIDTTRLGRWADSSTLNNGACVVDRTANGCEDVKIHHASSTAFLACGDPLERTRWYPAANIRTDARSSFRENLFKYDITKAKTTELKIHGLDGDLINHGLDIYSFPEDPSKVSMHYSFSHLPVSDLITFRFTYSLSTTPEPAIRS